MRCRLHKNWSLHAEICTEKTQLLSEHPPQFLPIAFKREGGRELHEVLRINRARIQHGTDLHLFFPEGCGAHQLHNLFARKEVPAADQISGVVVFLVAE